MKATDLAQELEEKGIVFLPSIVTPSQLKNMQKSFDKALQHPTWNTWLGYEQSEKHRKMLENMLVLDKSFVDFALNDLVNEVLSLYLGEKYVLTEARGWETSKTLRNFHGWHNDAWYAPELAEKQRPKEVKLAMYLSDTDSGYFRCVQKSHHISGMARHWSEKEIESMQHDIVDVKGKAGTAILFDTACIHRQAYPVLDPRRALFFNYHDPAYRLQNVDFDYGRYAPILLNPAYLGGITQEQLRVLGVGQDWHTSHFHDRKRRYPLFHDTLAKVLEARVWVKDVTDQGQNIVEGIKRRIPKIF